MVLLFLTGACSSGTSKATSKATSTPTSSANPAAFSQCMRANGVPNFPDFKDGEGVQLPAGLDRNSPAVKKADAACKKYMPADSGNKPENDTWSAADKLKYTQCMRTHGVPRFPDPKADGSIGFDRASGIDPESAQFTQAEAACKKYKSKEAQNAPKMKKGEPR